jgi:hypothetical protein
MVMSGSIISLLVALVLIVIAWKVFTGVVKTIALVAIVAMAAVYLFAFGGLA